LYKAYTTASHNTLCNNNIDQNTNKDLLNFHSIF
jgi:hypothetical protein